MREAKREEIERAAKQDQKSSSVSRLSSDVGFTDAWSGVSETPRGNERIAKAWRGLQGDLENIRSFKIQASDRFF